MNNQRRREIKNVMSPLDTIKMTLKQIYKDESEYYNSIPEHLRNSNNAAVSEESLDVIDTVIDYLDLAISIIHDDLP